MCQVLQISYGRIFIRLLKDDRSGSMVEVENLNEQDLEKLFHQLNNAFVDRLTFSFRRKDLTLPYYLRANASDLQCQIGALRIEGTSEAIDYALVDFLGACLKPQIYVVWMGQEQALMRRELCEDYAMLLKHDVLRGNVKHLECEVSKSEISHWASTRIHRDVGTGPSRNYVTLTRRGGRGAVLGLHWRA